MELVLTSLTRDICQIYLEDVVVVGKTLQEHNQNLAEVLNRIQGAELKLKPKKCLVACQSVEYLRHAISDQGIQTDPKKVEAVAQYPILTDMRSLRSI